MCPTVVEAQQRIQSAGVMVRTQVDHLGIHPPLTFTEIDTVIEVVGHVLEDLP